MGKVFIRNYEKRRNEAVLHENVIETLNYISQNEIPQSILSAYSQETLTEIIEHFELTKYFSNIVGLDHIYASSKLDNGKKLMQKLGLSKGEALFLGDTLHDLEVAEEIGADCVLVSHGHQSKERLSVNGNKVIDSISELKDILK